MRLLGSGMLFIALVAIICNMTQTITNLAKRTCGRGSTVVGATTMTTIASMVEGEAVVEIVVVASTVAMTTMDFKRQDAQLHLRRPWLVECVQDAAHEPIGDHKFLQWKGCILNQVLQGETIVSQGH
jgi:hypothetical protein